MPLQDPSKEARAQPVPSFTLPEAQHGGRTRGRLRGRERPDACADPTWCAWLRAVVSCSCHQPCAKSYKRWVLGGLACYPSILPLTFKVAPPSPLLPSLPSIVRLNTPTPHPITPTTTPSTCPTPVSTSRSPLAASPRAESSWSSSPTRSPR